jgi:hypothetical protein
MFVQAFSYLILELTADTEARLGHIRLGWVRLG